MKSIQQNLQLQYQFNFRDFMKKHYKILLAQSQKCLTDQDISEINSQTSIQPSLRIKKGSSFWSIVDDFPSIYNNFHLLSYFSASTGVNILDRHQASDKTDFLLIDQFSIKNNEKFMLVLNMKDQCNPYWLPKLPAPLKITYEIYKSKLSLKDYFKRNQSVKINIKEWSKLAKLQVEFTTEIKQTVDKNHFFLHLRNREKSSDKFRQYIHIKINDKDDWINKTFKIHETQTFEHRISEVRKCKVGEIQYFYKQPLSQRYKVIQEEHFSLALQGGGCKGIQYVGAYYAIRKNKPQTKIRNLIGSSIGTLLGLAFCCELSPDEINYVCETKLSKIISQKKYKTVAESENIMEIAFNKFFSSLRKMNIFQPKIGDVFQDFLADQKFQKLLFRLIGLLTNNQIQQLFIDQQTKKLNLAGLLNASLIQGDSLCKIAVFCIFKYLLKLYKSKDQKFMSKYSQVLQNLDQKSAEEKLYSIAETLKLKEFYYHTDIQFTCTAVDVDNQVLRFFNQKTTPDLPVCKAVQMSSSFPIAFQSLQWQKSWGKYYIHYDNIRREIDLTGCKMTDGGTLANFPLKYLDNEDMRPMYFSHVKTPNTIMYGIGIITCKPQNPEQKQQVQEILSQMGKIFSEKIGVCSPLFSWLCQKISCSSPKKRQITDFQASLSDITSIPLVQFVIKIVLTFCNTKDNLTEQCYSHMAHETRLGYNYKQQLELRPDNKKVSQDIERYLNLLKQLFPFIEEENMQISRSEIYNNFKNNLLWLKQRKSSNLMTQQSLCQTLDILNFNFSSFLFQLFKSLKSKKKKDLVIQRLNDLIKLKNKGTYTNNQALSLLFEHMHTLRKQKIFVLSGIQDDYSFLGANIEIFQQLCDQLKQTVRQDQNPQLLLQISGQNSQISLSLLDQILAQLHKGEVKELRKIVSVLTDYSKRKKQQNFVDRNISHWLGRIFGLTLTLNIQSIQVVKKQIFNSSIPEFFVYFEAFRQKSIVQSYIYKRIARFYNNQELTRKQQEENNSIKTDGIHVVLESISLSQAYFHEYYVILKESLLKYNESLQSLKQKNNYKPLQVSTITGTSYHCIIMFLHASDLQQDRIGEQVWKIRDLIKINFAKLEQGFKKGQWIKVTPVLLRDIQKMAVENKKDIFRYVQEHLISFNKKQKAEFNSLKQSLHQQINKVRVSNQEMVEAIQESLNFVVSSLMQIQEQNIQSFSKSKALAQKLALSKPFDHLKNFNQRSENFIKICNFFFEKYKDIIQYIVYQSPLIIDQIVKILHPQQREQAWKIAFLNKIVSGVHIKNYIQSILQELKLNPNITLKQFYDNSKKKIQLNLSVVEDSYVSIINYFTRPNMPVWAAILAATSIPQFFSPVVDRPQWKRKLQTDFNKRNVKSYFEQEENPYKLITSSQFLTRLPLDLLTNNKFQRKITKKERQIFIVFNFEPYKLPKLSKELKKKMIITPLTLGECVSKFVSFRSMIKQKLCKRRRAEVREQAQQDAAVDSFSLLKKIPSFQSKIKLINLFVESNDNLMRELYKRQIILMPVRFGTLDFNAFVNYEKGQKEGERKKGLSETAQDAIMQAEFIMTQKIKNHYQKEAQGLKYTQIKGNQKLYTKRVIFIRVQRLSQSQFEEGNDYQRQNSLSSIQQQKSQRQQKSNCCINMKIKIKQKRIKKLRLRFLSFLETSRQLIEKYFIYYLAKTKYVKLDSENLIIDQVQFKKLHLKIEYPSSDLLRIKTNYFVLDFQNLFNIKMVYNSSLNKFSMVQNYQGEGQRRRFAFVYCLQFNRIYSSENLEAVQGFQYDYMNGQSLFMQPPHIIIKSELKNAKQSVFCQKCVKPLLIKKDHIFSLDEGDHSYYICLQCRQTSNIRQKYKIYFNHQIGKVCCQKKHMLVRKNYIIDNFERSCDCCKKSLHHECWIDEECNIQICDNCRVQMTQMRKFK